jgi:hypothetical protein
MRTEVMLWASAYAERGDLVSCTATLSHSERSPRHHPNQANPPSRYPDRSEFRHLVIPTEAEGSALRLVPLRLVPLRLDPLRPDRRGKIADGYASVE